MNTNTRTVNDMQMFSALDNAAEHAADMTAAASYQTPSDIKVGDRVQHPDGRIGTVLNIGWAVQIQMDGEAKPGLFGTAFVVISCRKV